MALSDAQQPSGSSDLQHSNVYVSNLPATASEPEVRLLFEKHGTIECVRVVRSTRPSNGASTRTFAFVKFRELADAAAAIRGLSGVEHQGCVLDVKQADGDAGDRNPGLCAPPSDNLYCKNLDPAFGLDDVQAMFAPHGEIVTIRMLHVPSNGSNSSVSSEPTPHGAGALVRMASVEQASRALAALHNSKMPGSNLPVVVRFADGEEQKLRKAARQQRGHRRHSLGNNPQRLPRLRQWQPSHDSGSSSRGDSPSSRPPQAIAPLTPGQHPSTMAGNRRHSHDQYHGHGARSGDSSSRYPEYGGGYHGSVYYHHSAPHLMQYYQHQKQQQMMGMYMMDGSWGSWPPGAYSGQEHQYHHNHSPPLPPQPHHHRHHQQQQQNGKVPSPAGSPSVAPPPPAAPPGAVPRPASPDPPAFLQAAAAVVQHAQQQQQPPPAPAHKPLPGSLPQVSSDSSGTSAMSSSTTSSGFSSSTNGTAASSGYSSEASRGVPDVSGLQLSPERGPSNGGTTCSIVVKGLPYWVNKLFLYEHFGPYGPILSVQVQCNPSGACSGVGIVHFGNPDSAVRAVQATHGIPVNVSSKTAMGAGAGSQQERSNIANGSPAAAANQMHAMLLHVELRPKLRRSPQGRSAFGQRMS